MNPPVLSERQLPVFEAGCRMPSDRSITVADADRRFKTQVIERPLPRSSGSLLRQWGSGVKYIPPEQRPPAEHRKFLIFYARVNLREARARRLGGDRAFCNMLLGWAHNARVKAAAIRPEQGRLFG